MHGYGASSSHRGHLKKPCTYPNGPLMHIKLQVEASTGISSKTRFIILMQKKNRLSGMSSRNQDVAKPTSNGGQRLLMYSLQKSIWSRGVLYGGII